MTPTFHLQVARVSSTKSPEPLRREDHSGCAAAKDLSDVANEHFKNAPEDRKMRGGTQNLQVTHGSPTSHTGLHIKKPSATVSFIKNSMYIILYILEWMTKPTTALNTSSDSTLGTLLNLSSHHVRSSSTQVVQCQNNFVQRLPRNGTWQGRDSLSGPNR